MWGSFIHFMIFKFQSNMSVLLNLILLPLNLFAFYYKIEAGCSHCSSSDYQT